MTTLLDQDASIQSMVESLHREPSRLARILRTLADKRETRVLLFVDQREELFTLCDAPSLRASFLDCICGGADDAQEPVRVVMTVRDDFLGRLATSSMVREALRNVMVLERPTSENLVMMLAGPVKATGYRFEDTSMPREIANAVVDEPAGLPLLSFAADKLWELRDRDRKLLLRSTYDQFGGVEGALVGHADGVLDGLPKDQVLLARQLLLRLVTPERTRKVITRQEALEGLSHAATEVLDRLVDARLVRKTRDLDRSETQVDLAHESLDARL